eukprot:CAMPEP_0176428690 /NCGR_PEP_ID=MMETSP0127-20121128/13292_1 /TAXON_ID=938130 /ORGANISM="Platyophrya macrostoma, Strain WH" /LENGTH=878 /DNA_ID=CAMNT_0017810405 /DNA_START=330 /DNA_END=2966 /DNA_ORIENTATION=+
MTMIGDIIISGDRGGNIYLLDSNNHDGTEFISHLTVSYVPRSFLHPPTYVNKLLILGDRELELWNVRSGKQIFCFTEEKNALGKLLAGHGGKDSSKPIELSFKKSMVAESEENQASLQINAIANSPALDIIAVALSDGMVLLLNIKEDRIVQNFRSKDSRVTCMTFSNVELPLIACGTEHGEIIIWDLNNEKILSRTKNAHEGYVSYLHFARDELLFYSGSDTDNSLKQWKYDSAEDTMFYLLRERSGVSANIKKLRFYGDEGYHVFVSTFAEKAELRDFFIMNETFNGDFSLKENKKLTKQKTNTESLIQMSQVSEFDFSHNRAKDWANVLTCHKGSNKPYFWSSENHTIVQQNIKWEAEDMKDTKSLISQVHVSNCGNFGFLGYDDGRILKINMQSGYKQSYFHVPNKSTLPTNIDTLRSKIHDTAISGMQSDPTNQFLVSIDHSGLVAQWDFYSGTLLNILELSPQQVVALRKSKTSSLIGLAFDNYEIGLFDMVSLKKGRSFSGHSARITDFCFTIDNKFLLSTAMDKTLKIWDIIYGAIICSISLKQPIVSMDIDPTGEFLATVFLNSKEICLWNNNIGRVPVGDEKEIELRFMSEIKQTTSNNERSKYFSLVKVEGQQNDNFKINQEEYNDLRKFFNNALQQNEKKRELKDRLKMIQLEEEDIGKWLPLIHFDEIKEKNKPKEAVDQKVTAPFFLDFHPERQTLLANQIEGEIEDEDEKKESKAEKGSKIIRKHKRNELLDQVGSPIEKIIAKIQTGEEAAILKELYNQMKLLTPAQLDYELRKITFGNIPNVRKFLWLFCFLFKSDQKDYDLKQIYLYTFLNACYDVIANDAEVKILVEDLLKSLQINFDDFDLKLNGTICLIETFANIKN